MRKVTSLLGAWVSRLALSSPPKRGVQEGSALKSAVVVLPTRPTSPLTRLTAPPGVRNKRPSEGLAGGKPVTALRVTLLSAEGRGQSDAVACVSKPSSAPREAEQAKDSVGAPEPAKSSVAEPSASPPVWSV